MKKYITTILTIAMLAVSVPMFAGSTSAQTGVYNSGPYEYGGYDNYGYDQYGYNDEYYDQDYDYKKPNVYDRHRKAVNLSVGTGVGALVGALIGGKKGALIGAAAGLAGGAIVTAKQKPRNTTGYDFYRRN